MSSVSQCRHTTTVLGSVHGAGKFAESCITFVTQNNSVFDSAYMMKSVVGAWNTYGVPCAMRIIIKKKITK